MSEPQRPPYPVLCYSKNCPNEAIYKIAARWSDGVTSELKTYSLACPKCLPSLFRDACVRKAACRLAAGESLGEPQVFEMTRAKARSGVGATGRVGELISNQAARQL